MKRQPGFDIFTGKQQPRPSAPRLPGGFQEKKDIIQELRQKLTKRLKEERKKQ